MKPSFGRASFFVIVGSLLPALAAVAVRDDQATWREFFKKSRQQSDLKTENAPGFVLRGNLRVWLSKNSMGHGKYLYVWTPGGQWKEEIALPEYTRTRIGDSKQLWQVRSSEDENPATFALEELLNNSRAPEVGEKDTFVKGSTRTVSDMEIECLRRDVVHLPFVWSYCFNAKTNDLVEVSSGRESSDVPWRAAWQQASNFQEWSGKRVPLLLRGHNGKSLVAEVQFEEIKPLPAQLPKDFFAPAPGATTWADCGGRAAWKIKDRVRPEYPQSARIRHREGTVVLSAIIEADRSRRSSVEVQDSSFDLSGIEPVRSFVGIAVALRTYACMFWRPRLDRNVHRRCVLARAVKRYPPSASGQALSRVPG